MKEKYVKPAVVSCEVLVETQLLGASVITDPEFQKVVTIIQQKGNETSGVEGGYENPFEITDWDSKE